MRQTDHIEIKSNGVITEVKINGQPLNPASVEFIHDAARGVGPELHIIYRHAEVEITGDVPTVVKEGRG